MKIGDYTTSLYVASTSRRIHAIALNKPRKLQVTSTAGCRLTYLQFAGEFTRGVMADCLQLQVILCWIAGIFACVWRVFSPAILVLLPVSYMYFCLQKQAILHVVAGKVEWNPHVKLPVKYPRSSGKFTCTCKQIACILLDASTQVILHVFTGKLHVTQLNCVWGLFIYELQVKVPAFARFFLILHAPVSQCTAMFNSSPPEMTPHFRKIYPTKTTTLKWKSLSFIFFRSKKNEKILSSWQF